MNTAGGMTDVDTLQLVGNETGIALGLRVALLVGL